MEKYFIGDEAELGSVHNALLFYNSGKAAVHLASDSFGFRVSGDGPLVTPELSRGHSEGVFVPLGPSASSTCNPLEFSESQGCFGLFTQFSRPVK